MLLTDIKNEEKSISFKNNHTLFKKILKFVKTIVYEFFKIL